MNRSESIALLIKLDAENLFFRLKKRLKEAVNILSIKRSRTHFPELFFNRYHEMSIEQLSNCSSDLILSCNQYYQLADDIFWYIMHTEDMITTIEDHLDRELHRLELSLEQLQNCIQLSWQENSFSGESQVSEIATALMDPDLQLEIQDQAELPELPPDRD